MSKNTGEPVIAKSYQEDYRYLSSAWELTQGQVEELNFFNPILEAWLMELSAHEQWNSLNLLMLQTLSKNTQTPEGTITSH